MAEADMTVSATNEFHVKLNLSGIKQYLECCVCTRFMRTVTVGFDCFVHRCK